MKLTVGKLWQRLNHKIIKIVVVVLLTCLCLRLLPYLAPIHTADIAQNQLSMQFVDRNGLALGTLLTRDQQHTAVVPLAKISLPFIQGILAAEDGSFYHHGALDLKAIFRAIKAAIQSRKIVSGASTITMQLARMLEPSPRNLFGKFREIWLSWRLAAGMNKNDILSAYVNRLPMGGNIYGVEAAARTYFLTPASELNFAQGTLLAAIPNNPTYFNPYQHMDRLKQRQKYILNRMLEDGYISRYQAERLYAEKVVFQSRPQGIIAAPHFLFWLANHSQSFCQVREQTGSLPIQTTIDRPLQQFIEAQVKQLIGTLSTHNVHDAAAVVINNHSGEVLAYVGAPDYFNSENLGGNDGVQALRQPGSTLKPFVYELALEKNLIRPHTILADVPTNYAIPGAKLYSPTDYTKSFLGPVRVRIALANSLNVPAVRVLEKVGVKTFLQRLHELGFNQLNQSPEYYGLGLTLGSGEVSLWELARAYLTMARMGISIPLVTVLNDCPLLPVPNSPSPQVKIWQLIIDMLSDRHGRATAFGIDSLLNLPFDAAVKTGTSSNFRDTWAIGFSTDYTVATWVGNFTGEPMRQVSGITGATPLWNRIMLHLHEDQPPGDFPPPQGVKKLAICATTGLKPTANCTSVVQEYLFPQDQAVYEHPQSLLEQSDRFKIISPRNGDLFLVYPGRSGQQNLEFKVSGKFNQPIEWRLNGEKLSTPSDKTLFWHLQPGNWNLSVSSGTISDQLNFRVELASFPAKHRGFSE
jgi:penicillin-binding protein 1C